MIAILGYVIACVVGACFLTLVVTLFRSVRTSTDSGSWGMIVRFFLVLALGPYLYAEVMTRFVAKNLSEPISQALDDIELNGKLEYYRVLSYNQEGAHVTVVADEQAVWDKASERPVIDMRLERRDDGWKVTAYRFLFSPSRDKNGLSVPPYW